jgi:hypothetical protein
VDLPTGAKATEALKAVLPASNTIEISIEITLPGGLIMREFIGAFPWISRQFETACGARPKRLPVAYFTV